MPAPASPQPQVLATRMVGSTPTPDTRLHVWHCELDKISSYDFGERRPTSHFWDPMEPKLLGCETVALKRVTDPNAANSDAVGGGSPSGA
eukprot:SAG11_NODE_3158_length_2643_cov_2.460299_1_plen_89_part_10